MTKITLSLCRRWNISQCKLKFWHVYTLKVACSPFLIERSALETKFRGQLVAAISEKWRARWSHLHSVNEPFKTLRNGRVQYKDLYFLG